MMKEVVRAMESGNLAYIGLFAFLFAFALIMARVLMMKKNQRDELKNLPVNEPAESFPPMQ